MVEFLCLANSWREGARCVAGLVPGRGWVRPVPHRDGRAVQTHECKHFGLLDVVEADLGNWVPITGQRENVLLGPQGFSELREHNPARLRDELEALVDRSPDFLKFGGSDRVSSAEVQQRGIWRSLALVEPETVQWSITTNIEGRRRVQCHFTLAGNSLDLRVTDPVFAPKTREALKDYPLNSQHGNEAIGVGGQRLLLTASLGGEFQGNHYKLIAGVISFDR